MAESGGRGLRPWLLIPKYLCVATALGGIVAAGTLMRQAQISTVEQQRGPSLIWLGGLFTRQVCPQQCWERRSLGVALLLQHPRELLCMRWLRLKLVLLLVGIPIAHLMESSALAQLRRGPDSSTERFSSGLASAGLLLVIVIILGRGEAAAAAAHRATPGIISLRPKVCRHR